MQAKLRVATQRQTEMVDITRQIQEALAGRTSGTGVCHVYVPHTTAGVTINEAADPDVVIDLLTALDRLVPRTAAYRHAEGNADAHIKTALVGTSAHVPVDNGRLVLGTWQGIFLCEFDGPRVREVWLRMLAEH
ncbi:MAG: YjbQ family protein [Chloroflexota bacterium]|nr:MAG: YjbQ family protein [Chloroflexota bacterium]